MLHERCHSPRDIKLNDIDTTETVYLSVLRH